MPASVRSSQQNGARVVGTTGLTITKPASVANGDILVAFIGAGDDAGGAYTCGGWTQAAGTGSGAAATTTGNDIGTTVLFKAITNAVGEPASYTFVNTDTATQNRTGFIVCVQNGELTSGNVEELTQNTGANDWTPTHVNIDTATDYALCLFFHTGNIGTAAAKTAGAPATPVGTTLIGSIASSGTTANYSSSEAAYFQADVAGTVTVGAWTGTPDDTASEWHVYSVAIKSTVSSYNASRADTVGLSESVDLLIPVLSTGQNEIVGLSEYINVSVSGVPMGDISGSEVCGISELATLLIPTLLDSHSDPMGVSDNCSVSVKSNIVVY